MTRPCANCGAEFEPPRFASNHFRQVAKYCSIECRAAGTQTARAARRSFAASRGKPASDVRLPMPSQFSHGSATPLLEWDVSCLLHGTLTSYQWTVEYARLEQMAGRRRCAHCRQPVTISRALVTTAERVA